MAAAGYSVYLANDYTEPGHAVQVWSHGVVVLVVTVLRLLRYRVR